MTVPEKQADLLFEAQNTLGEGPVWHPRQQRLYWVDITEGHLFFSNQALTSFEMRHYDTEIGAFGFVQDGRLILATSKGFAFASLDNASLDILWNPLPERPEVRLNDGKVDPQGRFWAGSMDVEQQQGALYRIDPGGKPQTLLRGIGISNGLGWRPDGRKMYTTDSFTRTITVYDYEPENGQITHPRLFLSLPADGKLGVPDGLCVDAEGCIWSARWDGGQVVRLDPDGKQILVVKVPAQRVTSCFFGGADLDLLFITTARIGLSEANLAKQPHAGDVFVIKTDTQGQGTHFYDASQQRE